MEIQTDRIILLAGPTASGKSALALRLAAAIGAEVVNADSMQIYRDLRILTARPDRRDEGIAPHHLFGTVDAAEAWSAGRWLRAAAEALDDIARRGKRAVVVGGTGLYFNALTRGLAEIPPVDEIVRAEGAARLSSRGEAAFRLELAEVDPTAERRIAPGDRQRLVRAWAVARATARPLTDWQTATTPCLPPSAWRGIVLAPPRAGLARRCEARLRAMLAEGALEEVERLMARNLDPGLPIMKALGVAALSAQIRGEVCEAEALARINLETRQYAKRQATWFRNQAGDWRRIHADDHQAQYEELAEWVFLASDSVLTGHQGGGIW